MSPLRTRWTQAALLGSVALLSVLSVVAVRQRSGQVFFAQTGGCAPPGQMCEWGEGGGIYPNTCCGDPPLQCPNSGYCPNTSDCIPENGDCTTAGLPCCASLVCNTISGICSNGAGCAAQGQACFPSQGIFCCNGSSCDSAGAICGGGSVCGNSIVETGEQCDAGSANGTAASCCTASCTHKASGTVCRVADGVCDVAETCSGTNATCPQDTFKASTVECRASTDASCNPAEKCSGSANCPADVNNCSTAVCGDGVINTNAGEQCDGGDCCGNDCKFVAATQVCRGAAGPCDLAEICSGTTAACPADAFKSSTTECRAAVGACNPAEKCSGTSATCPTDTNNCPVGPNCGNGKLDLGEPCDGANLNGKTCGTQGFGDGTLSCSADCKSFVTTACTLAALCPNGKIDAGEVCDGTNLGGKTCVTQGYAGGTLSCKNCSFDTSKCTKAKIVFCCLFDQCKQQQPSDMCPGGQYADDKSCTDDCKKTGSSASSSSSEGDEETFICCFPDAKKEAQRCHGGMSFQDIEKGACPSGKWYSGNEMAVCKAECGVWRNIGTCGGWSKYDPEMPAGPSTVVTGIPPTAISPLLNCNGGTAKAKWAGETGFCFEDGKCSVTPKDANECAGTKNTVFGDFGDCEKIEDFGKL